MKKLISSVLAVTILVTPLVGSACFADEINEPRINYVQNENRSEKFKFKNHKLRDSVCKKLKKIITYVAAGAVVSSAIFKLLENCLPESNNSKLPFLFTKETQEDNEIIGAEVEKDEIIRFLETNSTTSAIADNITDTKNATAMNNTNVISSLKNTVANSAKDSVSGVCMAICTSLLLIIFFKVKKEEFRIINQQTVATKKSIFECL